MSFRTGTRLGRYEIVARLGRGGMGEVYLAEDTRLNRKVAIKFLSAESVQDQSATRRLLREAQAAAKLDHPNICSIHEVGEESGHSFIVMQYVEGETLASRMQRKPLELQEALAIAVQIADALAEAHSRGVIHRDIKPQNIMITPRGQVKVMDFGLAKVIPEIAMLESGAATQSLWTEPGMVVGTVPYMSPEQVRGETLDARSDIFSFGVVLFEMISGHQPFLSESTATTISAILTREPPPLARYSREIPAELERIVSKALAKAKDERYQTTKDLLIDSRRLKHQLELEAELERSAHADVRSGGQPAVETRSQPALEPEATAAGRSTAQPFISRIPGQKVGVAALVLAILVGSGIGIYLLTGGEKPIDSVAVLPFDNTNADPNTEYLSDGITESLINSLSQLPNLRVVPRSTVFRYKGREVEPEKIGRDLKVRAVLTGRVLQRGNILNMQAELVDVASQSQLWGEHYNRKLSDILAVQEEIAKEISEKLRLRLSGEEKKQLTKRYTENAEAYQLYLKGRHHATKNTQEGFQKGIEYFNQAIAIDPNYALAYDGLAYCYYASWYIPVTEAAAKGRSAVKKALEIDNTLAEAHASLATIHTWYDYNWSAAEREFKRAIDLKPDYAPAHEWYCWYLFSLGRAEESIAEGKRAVELEPLSAEINTVLGISYFYAKQYNQAFDQLNQTIKFEPYFWWAHLYLARVYQKKGEFPAAIAQLEKTKLIKDASPEVLSALGYAYAVSGNKVEAQKIIVELKEQSKRIYVPPYNLATIYAGLGEKDQAFEYLEKAYEERTFYMNLLRVDPELDGLRPDRRFADLLRRLNLGP